MIYQIIGFVVLAIIVGNFLEDKKMPPKVSKYPPNAKKYTAYVIGSTGAIGKELVKELSSSPLCEKVIAFTRRDGNNQNSKVKIVKLNFENPDENEFKKMDVGFNSLGSTIKKAGSAEAFEKIDYIIPLNIAKISVKQNTKSFFSVSSMGANANSYFLYPKTKGRLENEILNMNFDKVSIYRPGLLLAQREEFRFGEFIFQNVAKVINFLFVGPLKKYKAIHVETVARAMVNDFEKSWLEEQKLKKIYENDEIFKMAKM
eukprot:gene12254-5839_t